MSTGLWTTFVEDGAGSRGALGLDVQSWAGRTGRRSKPPPQFGHTFDRTAVTQSRQNVHSYVQFIALVALGGSGRLQFSHVGRSSSMSQCVTVLASRRPTRCAATGCPSAANDACAADEAGMTSVYEYAWCRDSGQTVACTVVRRGPLTATRSAELHR